MRRVYIAGPYSQGSVEENVRNAISAADKLLSAGFQPYVPHLTHFWHLQHPRDYEEWLELDLNWLAQCDILVRLPGDSPGADTEVLFAREYGIPVYYGLEELLKG